MLAGMIVTFTVLGVASVPLASVVSHPPLLATVTVKLAEPPVLVTASACPLGVAAPIWNVKDKFGGATLIVCAAPTVSTAFTVTGADADPMNENVTGQEYVPCANEFVCGVNATFPVAGPLCGETCSQLQACVAGIVVWKLAPEPELVNVIVCGA